ncbi:Rqc2 family fibronectin-binding protein [Zongyangia hominis]|uniref:Rqc2 homolog RqcH n=1 Tax=Zongyangia hominis TaxID=2763677 RepID=A0A926I6L5_9FIRM|nr:NFACT family protein [Zongyangia hominis]MBC8570179.1 NFACT family protein [Zongyangia hominis]
MALDAVYLSFLRDEIIETALEARVDKIYQPSREEIVLALRFRGGTAKLLLSASASSPRVHFTKIPLENPKAPPMFCMLLRKHLGAGKLMGVRQDGMERILFFDFETINELGDLTTTTVVMEIMGRHSNIIITDKDGKILDAIKRIDESMSSVRQVLPGMRYALPPQQHKKSLLLHAPDEIVEGVRNGRDVELSKALMEQIQGISPIVAREAAYYATRGIERAVSELGSEQWDRLKFVLGNFTQTVKERAPHFTMVTDLKGKPKDFAFLPVHQYGHSMLTQDFESPSALLDSFYSERDRIERMKQRSHDLLKLLMNTSERITRKIATQREELRESDNREQLRVFGDLLAANAHTLEKGQRKAVLANFYEEGSPLVEIPLDPLRTPIQNSQHYYTEYRKAATAQEKLTELIAKGEEELIYIESVFDLVTRTTGESELAAIREELSSQGYIKNYRARNKRPEKLSPLKYRSSDGFTILCGRNNLQNDRLTLKDSRNFDIWFHTQKIPGSHTVILTEGREVPDRTLEEAAVIAAYNSRARESAKVPVDYTQVKNVKKAPGAKPGMVIYDRFQTAVVDPDAALVERLKQ